MDRLWKGRMETDHKSTDQQRNDAKSLSEPPLGDEALESSRRTFVIGLAWAGMSMFTAAAAHSMSALAYERKDPITGRRPANRTPTNIPGGELNQSLIPETKPGKKPPTGSSSNGGSSGSSGNNSQSGSQRNCHEECEWRYNATLEMAWQNCRQVCD